MGLVNYMYLLFPAVTYLQCRYNTFPGTLEHPLVWPIRVFRDNLICQVVMVTIPDDGERGQSGILVCVPISKHFGRQIV